MNPIKILILALLSLIFFSFLGNFEVVGISFQEYYEFQGLDLLLGSEVNSTVIDYYLLDESPFKKISPSVETTVSYSVWTMFLTNILAVVCLFFFKGKKSIVLGLITSGVIFILALAYILSVDSSESFFQFLETNTVSSGGGIWAITLFSGVLLVIYIVLLTNKNISFQKTVTSDKIINEGLFDD